MQDYLNKVSPAYFKALKDAKTLQATTNKFSGKFIRPHAWYIKLLIKTFDIKSILDYGCGKGQQYEWRIPATSIEQWDEHVLAKGAGLIPPGITLEEYWGIEVTKFDPAVPKYAKEPEGMFDLVICSHVLGTIPEQDLPIIVDRIYSLTGKFLYVVEAIGNPKKDWTDEPGCPRGWYSPQWLELLAPPKPPRVTTELVVRYRCDAGSFIGRFRM